MEQVAVIDLGSNSIRFIIIEITQNGAHKLVYQEKESIRLSAGMLENNMCLTEEAQQRALKLLFMHILSKASIFIPYWPWQRPP